MAHGNNTENSNSTMEMGTSDQVLVTTKRKKKLTYVIGGMAMLVTLCVVVILIVMLSGNEAGVAEPIVSRRVSTEPNVLESAINSTQAPTLDNGLKPIELDDIISGVFSPLTFNGSWTSGNEILHRSANGDLVLYNLETGNSTTLISNTSKILEQSSRVMELSPDGSHVILAYNVAPVYRYTFLAKYGVIDISSGYVTHVSPPGLSSKEAYLQNFVWAPTGTGMAFVYLNNIYYQQNLTSTPQKISSNGKLNVVYNGIPDWVYEEEVFLSNNALWFSPDGNKLAYVTFDDSDVRVMRVPHYTVPGTDFQYTQHHEIRYPKPGTTNPTVTVTLRDLQTETDNVFNAPVDLDQPILKTARFATNDTIAIMWTNRVQTTLIVVLCSPGQTECKEIYRYTEENGWLDNNPLMFNKEGNAFITLQPQIVDGALFRQIVQISNEKNSTNDTNWVAEPRTNSKYTVGEILLWTDNDVIWYKATHVNDSAEQHVYYVDSSGNETCFTCGIKKDDGGECLYNDGLLSADGSRITITCGGPEVPQVFIYNVNGDLLKIWEDNKETAEIVSTRAMPKTVRLSVPTAVGYPDADVLIQVPHDYLSRKNIPLLVHVYGGPDTAFVTKLFNIDWGTSLVSRWGIAVAFIDGRGSGLKGSEYMFAVNRRLGTVEIEDQINVTRYLQENLSFLDRNRTCIWGWSYGAYAASLALARGDDVFRCAIAVAPVVDWRFYDSIYTERYMDTPRNNSQGYLEGSLLTENVVKAFRNKRYFLVHGTVDDNVHYQHAMLISRLLQRQDVFFTQMSYTDEDHGLMGVRPHLYHALEKFLEENML